MMEWMKMTMTMDNDSQGSFQPGPWCAYVPNWDGIEALQSVLRSAVMIYSYPTGTNSIAIE